MIRLSRATTIVAAAGPKSNTAAKTKVSETDRRAGIVGTLTVNDPLRRVSPARMNHSYPTGLAYRLYSECRTTARPATMTATKYTRPASGSGCFEVMRPYSWLSSFLVAPNNKSLHGVLLSIETLQIGDRVSHLVRQMVTQLVTPNDGVAPNDRVAPNDGVAPHDRGTHTIVSLHTRCAPETNASLQTIVSPRQSCHSRRWSRRSRGLDLSKFRRNPGPPPQRHSGSRLPPRSTPHPSRASS